TVIANKVGDVAADAAEK
ncbi:hypothetical protein D046_2196B, partial [Vibrio parahaemolyticus V-223/04]